MHFIRYHKMGKKQVQKRKNLCPNGRMGELQGRAFKLFRELIWMFIVVEEREVKDRNRK